MYPIFPLYSPKISLETDKKKLIILPVLIFLVTLQVLLIQRQSYITQKKHVKIVENLEEKDGNMQLIHSTVNDPTDCNRLGLQQEKSYLLIVS